MTEASHPDQTTLERVVEQAISLAHSRGATAAEAGVGVSTGLSVTVRLGEVETLEYQRDRSLGVTVYAGKRKGSASTATLTASAVEETVSKALSIASFTAADEFSGLPDAALMAATCRISISAIPGHRGAAAIELAKRCEAARSPRTRASAIPRALGRHAPEAPRLRQQPRLVGGYPSTAHSVSCVVLGQSTGDMQRDYWYTAARDWRGLEDVVEVGRRAARKLCSGSAPRSWRRARRRCCSRRNSRAGDRAFRRRDRRRAQYRRAASCSTPTASICFRNPSR